MDIVMRRRPATAAGIIRIAVPPAELTAAQLLPVLGVPDDVANMLVNVNPSLLGPSKDPDIANGTGPPRLRIGFGNPGNITAP